MQYPCTRASNKVHFCKFISHCTILAPVRFHHVPTVQFLIAPFSHIYYMQAMKNWTVGRPGKEASAYTNYYIASNRFCPSSIKAICAARAAMRHTFWKKVFSNLKIRNVPQTSFSRFSLRLGTSPECHAFFLAHSAICGSIAAAFATLAAPLLKSRPWNWF